MTFNLFPFAEEYQRQISVTLKGGAFKSSSGEQGIYILQPNSVNEKTWWLQKNGQFAIWHLPKGLSKRGNRWVLGTQKYLGQARGFMASPDDVPKPQEATTWKYYDNTIYKTSNPGDVIVANIPNSK